MLATLTACLSGTEGHQDRSAHASELCRVGATSQALFSGVQTPRTVTLRDSEILALVAVEPSDGEGELCTGTLIAHGWVLTAAHCVGQGTVAPSVRFGPDLSASLLMLSASVTLLHPEHDAALVQLPSAGWSRALGAEPISVWSASIAEDWVGIEIELAGRGLTETRDFGDILFVSEVVTALHRNTLEVDGMGHSGACLGDSGGPVLKSGEGGVVHVVGTLTRGSSGCTANDLYLRADRIRDWAVKMMANHPVPESDPCELL